jgi:type IV secretion system protein VirD4
MTANAMLARIDTTGIRKMMSNDNVELCKIGSELTAIFVEISDTDRSKDLLANVFYSQAMSELCRSADNQPDHRLSVPVRFILDDFGTTSNIAGFENMISNIRSRRISAMIVIQSLSQLERRYGESSHTIIDNCDTMLYMGGNDVDTAEYIAKRCNKSLGTILSMPVGRHWQFRRGQKPKFCNTEDLSVYSFRCREEDNAAC